MKSRTMAPAIDAYRMVWMSELLIHNDIKIKLSISIALTRISSPLRYQKMPLDG